MTDQERQFIIRQFIKAELEEHREQAEALGISLQEYLLLRILKELQQIQCQGES